MLGVYRAWQCPFRYTLKHLEYFAKHLLLCSKEEVSKWWQNGRIFTCQLYWMLCLLGYYIFHRTEIIQYKEQSPLFKALFFPSLFFSCQRVKESCRQSFTWSVLMWDRYKHSYVNCQERVKAVKMRGLLFFCWLMMLDDPVREKGKIALTKSMPLINPYWSLLWW